MRSKDSASRPLRERAFGDAGFAAHGVEQALGGVDAVEIARDFAAEEAAGDGVGGVALYFGGFAR